MNYEVTYIKKFSNDLMMGDTRYIVSLVIDRKPFGVMFVSRIEDSKDIQYNIEILVKSMLEEKKKIKEFLDHKETI